MCVAWERLVPFEFCKESFNNETFALVSGTLVGCVKIVRHSVVEINQWSVFR